MAAGRAEQRERVSHVFRRLSMGAQPDLVARAGSVDEAIARCLDLSAPVPTPYDLPVALTRDEAEDVARIREPFRWWFDRMAGRRRLVEERLVWFWHDHFATGIQKVRSPDLMWRQHRTIRAHATGSFADLLRAMATDPAMLVYLDGVTNSVTEPNENYGREVMELHTLGRGNYSQEDVVAAGRAFSGWLLNVPFLPRLHRPDLPPYDPYFVPARHDAGRKTLLGVTGRLDADRAIDILLDHPATARFVAAKLHRELVGLDPEPPVLHRLARRFRRGYRIMPLVEAIVEGRAFRSDAALRAKVRTPLERLVGLVQAVGARELPDGDALVRAFVALGFVPFAPPNPAGYPKGPALLGPHQLVHAFDLGLVLRDGAPRLGTRDLLARFGLFRVGRRTRDVVGAARDPRARALLVATSPEYALV